MTDHNVTPITPLTAIATERVRCEVAEVVANTTALALDLTRALRSVGVTTEGLDFLTESTWLAAARAVDAERRERRRAAGEHVPVKRQRTTPPSASTRAAVRVVFKDQDDHPDPFEGFPA